jgi:hypothetical protein
MSLSLQLVFLAEAIRRIASQCVFSQSILSSMPIAVISGIYIGKVIFEKVRGSDSDTPPKVSTVTAPNACGFVTKLKTV